MRRFRALAALLAVASGGCSPHYSAHYRTTVQVQTPHGVVEGSAVRAVQFGASVPIPIPLPGEDRPHWEEWGEAVAVDLPGGQTLFALLGRPYDDGSPLMEESAPSSETGLNLWPNTPVSSRMKSPYSLPLLVRFRDINDPTTVEEVDPRNLAASFGSGFVLKSINIKVTHDAVTKSIGNKLRWLGPTPEPSLKEPHDGHDWSLAARLTHGDFRQGDPK